MGNYATTAELEARFGGDAELAALTDNEDAQVADATVLGEVIDDAEGEIDSYLAGRYLVPVDVTDTVVAARMRSVTLDLAVWRLHVRQGTVPDPFKDARDAVVAWLERVRTGESFLPDGATPSPTTSRQTLSAYGTAGTTSSAQGIFSRATQSGL